LQAYSTVSTTTVAHKRLFAMDIVTPQRICQVVSQLNIIARCAFDEQSLFPLLQHVLIYTTTLDPVELNYCNIQSLRQAMVPLGLLILNRSVNVSQSSCHFEHDCLCGKISLRQYGNTENLLRKYTILELWSRCEQQIHPEARLHYIDFFLSILSYTQALDSSMSLKHFTLRA